MRIDSARYEHGSLILSTLDPEAIRLSYRFEAGEYEITKAKKKRSLDANAYCWSLLSKIADVLRASKEEIYLDMLKKYGQAQVVSVRSDIDVSGYFKYCEEFGLGTVNGKEFTHYKVYKGSSEFDTREMSILIDGIIEDAKLMDIETATPQELERMKQEWR